MFVRIKSSCFITNIFLFYAENALKMQKMWTLKNYADPHHRILSDALNYD